MNNLWNRSVGPFDEAAVQRHRHMGLLDCNGDVNADAVNFLAHLCAGLFFDALCDSYVEMQTVSRISRYPDRKRLCEVKSILRQAHPAGDGRHS